MDALSDVLRVAHLTGGVFLHADFFAPWCMAARVSPEHCAPAIGPASHLIVYHYVVEGAFRIRLEGESGEGTVIGAGEVVLLPRNDLHLMGSDLDTIDQPAHAPGPGSVLPRIAGSSACASAQFRIKLVERIAGMAIYSKERVFGYVVMKEVDGCDRTP